MDEIMITSKWKHSLLRVRRQADIGSDHNLVIAWVREQFNITLKNRYSILQDVIALTIDQFHQAMSDAAAETICCKGSAKTEWLSKGTWSIIEERKKLKKILLDAKSPWLKESSRFVRRERLRSYKKSARRDRRYYIEQLAEDTPAAAKRNDMKTFYQITKKSEGWYWSKPRHPRKNRRRHNNYRGNSKTGEVERSLQENS